MNQNLVTLLAVLSAAWPVAALEVASIFGDHMVLQRDMPVPVWGTAEPGEMINVSMSGEGGVSAEAVADEQGEWRVSLPAMEASNEPRAMRIVVAVEVPPDEIGKPDAVQQIWIKDILIGEVWHISGQSNMEWPIARARDAEAEQAAADYPAIRMARVQRTAADSPRERVEMTWRLSVPGGVGGWSAVGYFMGRELHRELGVPVGLIHSAWGGAPAEAFVPIAALEAEPAVLPYLDEVKRKQNQAGTPGNETGDAGVKPHHTPAAIYNGMIHPIAPYAIRGVAWYQGESNAGRAEAYRTLMPLLIREWRAVWDQPGDAHDFPFLQVQLASFGKPVEQPGDHGWASLRDAQRYAAHITANAWLATAIDLGEANDIHPTNKQEVGRRLALLALKHVYGHDDLAAEGPMFQSLDRDGDTLILRFNHARGLTTTDGQPPRGFAIASYDTNPNIVGEWRWAEATLDGDTVRLTLPPGEHEHYLVRYAWAMNPTDGPHGINLVNAAGLPAYPFQFDTEK